LLILTLPVSYWLANCLRDKATAQRLTEGQRAPGMMMHAVFGGVFAVSLVIGIVAFFLGCNPNLDNQCMAYDMVEGTVYDYKFTTDTCKRCLSRSNNHCTRYDYYPCYSAYVKFHYGSNNTCNFETKKDSKSESAALNSVNKYDIGEKKNLLRSKSGSACSEPETGLIAWGVGVAFLALSGLVLCGWLGFTMVFGCQQSHSENDDMGCCTCTTSSSYGFGYGSSTQVMPLSAPVASYESY